MMRGVTIGMQSSKWVEQLELDETLHKAVKQFGAISQTIVAIEELSELQKELTKELRLIGNIDHLAEEVADVEIMLDQLRIIYPGLDYMVDAWRRKKITRLESRLKEEV